MAPHKRVIHERGPINAPLICFKRTKRITTSTHRLSRALLTRLRHRRVSRAQLIRAQSSIWFRIWISAISRRTGIRIRQWTTWLPIYKIQTWALKWLRSLWSKQPRRRQRLDKWASLKRSTLHRLRMGTLPIRTLRLHKPPRTRVSFSRGSPPRATTPASILRVITLPRKTLTRGPRLLKQVITKAIQMLRLTADHLQASQEPVAIIMRWREPPPGAPSSLIQIRERQVVSRVEIWIQIKLLPSKWARIPQQAILTAAMWARFSQWTCCQRVRIVSAALKRQVLNTGPVWKMSLSRGQALRCVQSHQPGWRVATVRDKPPPSQAWSPPISLSTIGNQPHLLLRQLRVEAVSRRQVSKGILTKIRTTRVKWWCAQKMTPS